MQSECLFDLDVVAPPATKTVATTSVALGERIAAKATAPMAAASRAIGRWVAGTPVTATDAELQKGFIDGSGDALSVSCIVPMLGGGLLLELTAEQEGPGGRRTIDYVAHARWSADRTHILDCAGREFFTPPSLESVRAIDDNRVYCSEFFSLFRIIEEWGPVVRCEKANADADDSRFICLREDLIETPVSYIADADLLPDASDERFWAVYMKGLRASVAALMENVSTFNGVMKGQQFLCEQSGQRHAQFPDDFMEPTIEVLKPLADLYQWAFDTTEWIGRVEMDFSSGWSGHVSVCGVHKETNREVSVNLSFYPSSFDGLEAWTNPTARIKRAIATLGEHLAASKNPQTEDPRSARHKASSKVLKLALAANRAALVETIAALRPLASTSECTASIAFAETVIMEDPTSVGRIDTAYEVLRNAFCGLCDDEVRALTSLRVWTAEDVARLQALLVRITPVQDHLNQGRPEDQRRLATIADYAVFSPIVRSIDGWWVSIDAGGGIHGAVSGTGYYSGCRDRYSAATTDTEFVKHLIEGDDPRKFLSQREWAGPTEAPGLVRAWINSLRHPVDVNIAHRVRALLSGRCQQACILAHFDAILTMIETASPSSGADDLYRALDHSDCPDSTLQWQAGRLQWLLTEHLGFSPASSPVGADDSLFEEQPTDQALEEDDDAVDDDLGDED